MSDQALNTTDNNASNKRKRDSNDNSGPDPQRMTRSSHGSNGNIQSLSAPSDGLSNFAYSPATHGLPNAATTELSQIDQQILQHVGPQNGITDETALTAKAALAAHAPQNKYPPPPDGAYDSTTGLPHGLTFGDEMNTTSMGTNHGHTSTAAAVYAAREAQSMNSKPTVGSPEWHTIRKNNHKEVERRRRETINEGINQISQLVPNCDKNKGAILQRAIEYINHLHEERKTFNDRWERHSITANEAISEISSQNSKLKAEVNRRGDLATKWIQRCRDAGLEFDDYDDDKELGQLDISNAQTA
jgi:bHLH factor